MLSIHLVIIVVFIPEYMLTLSKTMSPQKLLQSDCITLYRRYSFKNRRAKTIQVIIICFMWFNDKNNLRTCNLNWKTLFYITLVNPLIVETICIKYHKIKRQYTSILRVQKGGCHLTVKLVWFWLILYCPIKIRPI